MSCVSPPDPHPSALGWYWTPIDKTLLGTVRDSPQEFSIHNLTEINLGNAGHKTSPGNVFELDLGKETIFIVRAEEITPGAPLFNEMLRILERKNSFAARIVFVVLGRGRFTLSTIDRVRGDAFFQFIKAQAIFRENFKVIEIDSGIPAQFYTEIIFSSIACHMIKVISWTHAEGGMHLVPYENCVKNDEKTTFQKIVLDKSLASILVNQGSSDVDVGQINSESSILSLSSDDWIQSCSEEDLIKISESLNGLIGERGSYWIHSIGDSPIAYSFKLIYFISLVTFFSKKRKLQKIPFFVFSNEMLNSLNIRDEYFSSEAEFITIGLKGSFSSEINFLKKGFFFRNVQTQDQELLELDIFLGKDQYLLDHVYNEMFIVPTVFMHEIVASAVWISKKKKINFFSDFEYLWPVVVRSGGKTILRIAISDGPEYEVLIFTDATLFKKIICRAKVVSASAIPRRSQTVLPNINWSLNKLYNMAGYFFVGRRYMRNQSVLNLSRNMCLVSTFSKNKIINSMMAFGINSQSFLLPDPFARDAALWGALIPQFNCQAFTIHQRDLYFGRELLNEEIWVEIQEIGSDKQTRTYRISGFASDGELVFEIGHHKMKLMFPKNTQLTIQQLMELEKKL